ncbi:hypothetical protein A0H81_11125 [Grifola frondosa]|uniref:Uncharacterized protein n=1 Tax=Grifola frondosa TaxID=5627 RepID=A0A1C7LXR3_GRIFR|nr:hypothetical protein A0H81_11125 [Grifola frondosa]
MRRSSSLSTAAAFEPHRSPSSPKLPYRPSYQDKRLNSLPNRTVKFDVKSLNLHLSSRVQDVLACAEAMWDYVVDYQMGASPRVPPNSPPPFHQQPVRLDSSPELARSASVGADPIKSALMNLTRDEFDALLTRFELDMQDSINLSMVVEDRLAWAPVTPSRTEERKAFDELCAAWDRYQNVHGREDRSRGSTDTVRPQESHPYADANVASSPPRKDVASAEYEDSLKGGHGDEDVRASSRLPAIPPSHRLNRSARVFVAWKA